MVDRSDVHFTQEDEEVCKTVTATIISRWLIEVERRKKEEMKQRGGLVLSGVCIQRYYSLYALCS